MDDLKSAVQTAFGNVVSSGAIEAAIEKQLAAALAVNAQLVEALRKARYAIKGREHTGFIDDAITAAGAA